MNYSNKYARFVAIILCAGFLLLTSLSACTEVDDRLGEGLLPGNQKMKVEVATFTDAIKTYLYRGDSLPASRLGYGYLGRMRDADGVFGASTNSVLVQFLPSSKPYENAEGYGIDPIVDSIRITFTVDKTKGDVTKTQNFEIYDVVEGPEGLLRRDLIYHANFSIEKRRGEKLFEFSHSGNGTVSTRLFPTAAGRRYLDSIVHLGWDDYTTDSLFYKKFQGLYITPAEGSPAEAAVYAAKLENSGFELYVRNHDTLDVSAIYDTLRTVFTFRDSDYTNEETGIITPWDNVSINMAEFDYTGSELGRLQVSTGNFTDTLPTSPDQPLGYIQSMGGVGTMLRFDSELIDELQALGAGNDVLINQAMVYIWLKDSSTPSLDASIKRLGSYLNLSILRSVPDYRYASERAAALEGEVLHNNRYNGYLNRSGGYYEFDITAYIQQLAKGNGKVPPFIYLAPEAYDLFGLGESVLEGSGSERPIDMRITYTIIGK